MRLSLFILFFVLPFYVQAKNASAKESALMQKAKSHPVFVANVGQITDQYGNRRSDIDFKFTNGGLNVFIGRGGLHYQWNRERKNSAPVNTEDRFGIEEHEHDTSDSYRLDIMLENANKNAILTTGELQPYTERYYTAQFGEEGGVANTYTRIVYSDVYPHIDWVLYVNEEDGSSLKYDFIIHKGGNPADIQLRYEGAEKLKLVNGCIKAETPYGYVADEKPYSYDAQTQETVASSFILNGNRVGYKTAVAEHDMVIDPMLHWSTYFGGSDYDYGASVATDTNSFIYISGRTRSTSNIATVGAHQVVLGGVYDCYIAKFNSGGELLWSTYYGGTEEENNVNIIVDRSSGNIYVSGDTHSNNAIVTAGAHQTSYGSNTLEPNGFLVKFNDKGVRQWGTYYGGNGWDFINGLDCDAAGNVFISGYTNSPNNIASSGSYMSTSASTVDGFIAKFNANGVRQWGTYFGGNDNDGYLSLCIDNAGNIVIAGNTVSTTGIATAGSYDTSYNGGSDIFIAKFSNSGSLLWGTYYGGTAQESVQGITTDINGDIYIAGAVSSTTGIATPGAYQTSYGGGSFDGVIAKFSSNGSNRQWGTYYGGTNGDYIMGVAVLPNNDIVVGGWTFSQGLATAGAPQTSLSGGSDILLVQLNAAGSRLWATYYGGTLTELVSQYLNTQGSHPICTNKQGQVIITGSTGSLTGIASGMYIHQGSMAGIMDACLAVYSTDTTVLITPVFDTLYCVGDSFNLGFTVSYPFAANNTFTLQLSDSNGSFASPVTLAAKSSVTNDIFSGVIPSNISPGKGYRVRVVSSNPYRVSADNGKNILIGTAYPAKPVAGSNSPVCVSSALNLTASTTTAGVWWKWTGPSGFSSNLQNPVINNISAGQAGAYIVTAYSYGCGRKDTTNVSTIQSASGISAGPDTSFCWGDSILLSAKGAPTGTIYSWTGPNAFTASRADTSILNITGTNSGAYIITATLNGCINKDTVQVSVISRPASLIATSNSPICAGDSIHLMGSTTTTGVTWVWAGPAGYISTLQNPSIGNATTTASGNYILIATINNCSSRDTVSVIVNTMPAPVTAGSNSPVCQGNTLSLTASTTTAGLSYSWTGPGSYVSSVQNPAITTAPTSASGDYIMTATNGGCTIKDTVTVLVKPIPANVTTVTNSPICAGNVLSITANSTTTGVLYAWTGPNSFTSLIASNVILNAQPAASGDYIVTVTLNGCSVKDTATVIVSPIPSKPVASYNSPLCAGETLSLHVTTIAGATYSWTGPGFSSSLQNPAISPAQSSSAGAYIVSATANGCTSAKDTITVVVNAAPQISIYPSPNDTACQNANVTFVAIASGGGTIPHYQWMKNSQLISGATNPSWSSTSIANNDIISCMLTNSTTCYSPQSDTSNIISMTIMPWLAPVVTIISNMPMPLSPWTQVLFTATATNAGTNPAYQWQRNGNNIVGATATTWGTFQLSDNDSIGVVVTSSYMCPSPATAVSNIIRVTLLTGIPDLNTTTISVYPNPVHDAITIDGLIGVNRLRLTDIAGRLIYERNTNSSHEQLNMLSLPGAIYILQVSGDSGYHTYKLVKE